MRTKRILRKASGEVMIRLEDADPKTFVPIPKPTIKVDGKAWTRVSIERPSRRQLTKKQWEERGDLLRIIKRIGTDSARAYERMSLADLRELKALYDSEAIQQLTV